MAIKHLTPRSRKEIKLAKANRTYDEKVEEFIEEFAEKGSALDIYMPYERQKQLYDYIVNQKYKAKIISFEYDDQYDDYDYENKYSRIERWIERGWEEFNVEDNYGYVEVILIRPSVNENVDASLGGVKKPYSTIYNTPGVGNPMPAGGVNEDAMGGVSSPGATLNNTPGVGNVVPAGVDKIGSGDKFGNVIGNKPYTQTNSLKKKKTVVKKPVTKKKKLEEENVAVAADDKLGNMILKQAKVPKIFTKAKEKGNQRSQKSKKFEHKIILFDEFKKLME